MNVKKPQRELPRREFLTGTGKSLAGLTLASLGGRGVFAAEDSTIRLALIGCGGRGSGAVGDALSVRDQGQVQLAAMADLDASRMSGVHDTLKKRFGEKVDVPEERRFVGFDAFRQAVDFLKPGDIAMCTTRAYIRPTHVEYAIEKGLNVFMEKPFASDPAGLHRLLRAGEEADRKNLKISAGLQCRHSPARQALIQKIRAGEMGDIHTIRANRLGGGGGMGPQGEKAFQVPSQLLFGRVNLFWVGSGHMVDYLIHQIDEACWIKDAWPVSVVGMGGRVPLLRDCGQNLDTYSMEYTFADGTKAFCGFRRTAKARNEFATFVHGSKCAAQFSGDVHAATVQMYQDQRIENSLVSWRPEKDAYSPWQYEWNEFIKSIREDRPHNETRRAVYSDLATIMGRAACHTGQRVTWEQMMASTFSFCPDVDLLREDSPVPVKPDGDGQFPVPIPGEWKEV